MGWPSLKEDIDELRDELLALRAGQKVSTNAATNTTPDDTLVRFERFLSRLSEIVTKPELANSYRIVTLEWQKRSMEKQLERSIADLSRVKQNRSVAASEYERPIEALKKENRFLLNENTRLRKELSEKNEAIRLFKSTGKVQIIKRKATKQRKK